MTDDLTTLDGIGPAIAEQLRESGFETAEDVLDADVEELADVHMLGESSAAAILGSDKSALGGRDFEIEKSDHDNILQAAREGKSKRGCARAAGVGRDSLDRYLDANDEFRDSFERARAQGESRLIRDGLYEKDADASMAKFLLSTSFEYVKTERREHDVEADVTHDFAEGWELVDE